MRIIHTADVHLHTEHPERLKALKEVLKVARENKVDLVTIAGDLFDNKPEAEKLRPVLRDVFSGNHCKVLACPGNHDADVYGENLDFGPDFLVLGMSGLETRDFGGVTLTAMPYQDMATPEVLASLKIEANGVNLLLLHCTLDVGFAQSAYGEESAISYFPVTATQLGQLGYDCILAGHFHSRGIVKALPEKGRFIYPGSPASITRSEIGRRFAYLIEISCTGEIMVSPIALKSYFVNRFVAELMPENQDTVLKELAEWLPQNDDAAELTIDLSGFILGDERDFRESLESLITRTVPERAPYITREYTYRTVDELLKREIYRDFIERLAGVDAEERVKAKMRRRFISALSQVVRG